MPSRARGGGICEVIDMIPIAESVVVQRLRAQPTIPAFPAKQKIEGPRRTNSIHARARRVARARARPVPAESAVASRPVGLVLPQAVVRYVPGDRLRHPCMIGRRRLVRCIHAADRERYFIGPTRMPVGQRRPAFSAKRACDRTRRAILAGSAGGDLKSLRGYRYPSLGARARCSPAARAVTES